MLCVADGHSTDSRGAQELVLHARHILAKLGRHAKAEKCLLLAVSEGGRRGWEGPSNPAMTFALLASQLMNCMRHLHFRPVGIPKPHSADTA